jgi:hypothetical protein
MDALVMDSGFTQKWCSTFPAVTGERAWSLKKSRCNSQPSCACRGRVADALAHFAR